MQCYTNNIQNTTGDARGGVSVLVQQGGVDAVIYSDDGMTTQANPMTTDENGMFSFFAANGNYVVTAQGTGLEPFTVSLFDGTDPVVAEAGTLTGTTLAANVVNASLSSITPAGGVMDVGGQIKVDRVKVVSFNNSAAVRIGEEDDATGKQLWLGYMTGGNYATLQAIHNGSSYRPLVIQEIGGNLLVGTSTDTGEKLKVSGDVFITGSLKYGAVSAVAAEIVTGYITILDSGGTPRKVAILS